MLMKTSYAFGLLCCIVALLALSLSAQPALAGFTSIEVDHGDGTGWYVPEWGPQANGVDAWASVDEYYGPGHTSYDLAVRGETDIDPILTITKDIFNGSGFTWLGYEITLETEGGAVFDGLPTSVGMTYDGGSSTSNYLLFGLPSPVPNGSSVSFTFDIEIPTTGDFSFTLTQSPIIPEPTTMALAGIAGLMILAARRKRSL
jgi:hypothetical protein